jgi:hypothetical protein
LDTVRDFEDMLELLERFEVRYLIIGGLAFIFHAKPRYTKDIDLWVDPAPDNIRRANEALEEFGSPHSLEPGRPEEILQLGVAPNRIDFLQDTGVRFEDAWQRRVAGHYGATRTWWVHLDDLIAIKSRIDDPRHQEDARILKMVRENRSSSD